jgi:CCR4-NOT transcriptional regulation complex NOT5 subunit
MKTLIVFFSLLFSLQCFGQEATSTYKVLDEKIEETKSQNKVLFIERLLKERQIRLEIIDRTRENSNNVIADNEKKIEEINIILISIGYKE